MKAMFINENEHPYAYYIITGLKTIETRSRNMLAPLVGERVAVVRTFKGAPAMVVGYVTVVDSSRKDWSYLNAHRGDTMIMGGSEYDTPERWCYFLENATPCEPYPLPADAVRHGRSWCEFEEVVRNA